MQCTVVGDRTLSGVPVPEENKLNSGQLSMAQGSVCMECIRWCSKLIIACAPVNQLYIKGCCINCDYITLALELPRKWADWMHSKFNVIHWFMTSQIVSRQRCYGCWRSTSESESDKQVLRWRRVWHRQMSQWCHWCTGDTHMKMIGRTRQHDQESKRQRIKDHCRETGHLTQSRVETLTWQYPLTV